MLLKRRILISIYKKEKLKFASDRYSDCYSSKEAIKSRDVGEWVRNSNPSQKPKKKNKKQTLAFMHQDLLYA